MPSMHEWYVVDEAALSAKPSATDQATYTALVKAVRANGARWTNVEMGFGPLAKALEAIDAALGSTGFVPVLSFNNSPHNILGNDPSIDADFGYMSPAQVQDLWAELEGLPPAVVERFDADEVLSQVFYAVRDAAEEAASRGHAIAVLHDAP